MIDRGTRKNVMGGVEEPQRRHTYERHARTFKTSGSCTSRLHVCPVTHSILESMPLRVLKKIKIKIRDANLAGLFEGLRDEKGALDSVAW
jgi:hypothetical protein